MEVVVRVGIVLCWSPWGDIVGKLRQGESPDLEDGLAPSPVWVTGETLH